MQHLDTPRPFLLAMLALTLLVPPLAAEDEKTEAARGGDEEEVEFVPRSDAPPAKRVGAGTRGDASLEVVGLAPAKTLGYTTRGQPVVYFSFSKATKAPIEIVINDRENVENPVCELVLEKGHPAGLLRVDFAKLKDKSGKAVTLPEGGRYEVAVSVDDKEAGSANATAVVPISRVSIDGKPQGPDQPLRLASFYAKRGIWFDCIEVLNTALRKSPDDARLLAARAKLLAGEGMAQAKGKPIREDAPAN